MGIGRVLEQQRQWARESHIPVDEKGYVKQVESNLFEDLTPDMRQEFDEGDGDELGGRHKMQALHSSSALCCNVFAYLRRQHLMGEFLGFCGLRDGPVARESFEERLPITSGPSRARFRRPANLDLVVEYADASNPLALGLESKFAEPYRGDSHSLSSTYLAVPDIWKGLEHCRHLAGTMVEACTRFVCLDAAQLLKHILALRNKWGDNGFVLAYLWYDVGGDEGRLHRDEAEQFSAVVKGDAIRFVSNTYQELIPFLARRLGDAHRTYSEYLTKRYLA